MEIPKEIREQFKKGSDRTDQAAKKKLASIHYKRRKLDKDVKQYIKYNTIIRSREIEQLGRRHGFHITGTPFRENTIPHEDA